MLAVRLTSLQNVRASNQGNYRLGLVAFAFALSILSYWIPVSFLHHCNDLFFLAIFKGTKKIHGFMKNTQKTATSTMFQPQIDRTATAPRSHVGPSLHNASTGCV